MQFLCVIRTQKMKKIFSEYFLSHWGAYLDNVFQALKSNILDIIHLIIYI